MLLYIIQDITKDVKLRATTGIPFKTSVLSYSNYYPFGMQYPDIDASTTQNATYQSAEYRYGYNGKEKDGEAKGEGNSYDYGARIYDPRIGRWMSTDKAEKSYPSMSPYAFSLNSPIQFKDEDGNVVRDKDGNIVFSPITETDSWEHHGKPGVKYKMTIGLIYADNGAKIKVYKNTDVGTKNAEASTNCHGVSFANGEYWIDDTQIPTLLKGDGYEEVDFSDKKVGDIVLYTSDDDRIEDSRTVTADVTKVYGQGGLEEESITTDIESTWTKPTEDAKARIYRKKGKDKKLKSDKEKNEFLNKVYEYKKGQTDAEFHKEFNKEKAAIDKRSDKLKPNKDAHTINKQIETNK